MFLKTVGAAFIIAGFGCWGLVGAKRMEKRVEQIKDARMAINFLEKEITYVYTPLSRALAKTARFCNLPVAYLFQESADKLRAREGVTAYEAWMSGIQKIEKASELKEADIELLAAIAPQLGLSEAEEQKKFFALIQEELRVQEKKALQEVESERKLFAYGGFIFGALIVLLLL